MPHHVPLRTRRRTTLGGLAAGAVGTALAGSGCLAEQRRTASAGPRSGEQLSDQEVDAAVLDQAIAATREAITGLEATGEAHPGLSGALAGLLATHRAHLAVLADARSATTTTSPGHPVEVPGRSPAALAAVRRGATHHQRRFVELAMQARSGTFARLLASISAAVGQQLAVLPRPRRDAP